MADQIEMDLPLYSKFSSKKSNKFAHIKSQQNMEQENLESNNLNKNENIESQEELKLLRSRIDLLEIKNAEKNKAWYKNASIIISFCALAFTIIMGVRNVIKDNISDIIAKRTEALQTVIRLIETEEDEKSKIDIITDSIQKEDALNTLHDKRAILLSRLDDINKNIPNKLSFREYLYIGTCNQYDGEPKRCPLYWLNAVKAANDIYDSLEVYQYFASYYFIPYSTRDTAKGNFYMSKAIELVHSRKEYNFKYMLCDLYCSYANYSDIINDTTKVFHYLALAKNIANNIPKNASHYKEAIDSYNNVINELMTDSDNKYQLDSLPY